MYLKLDRYRYLQYDFGLEITGSVYEDARRTKAADISGFSEAEFRFFREGTSYARMEATLTGNRFTARVPENTFLRTGYFPCNLNMKATGRSVTTFNEEIQVVENAV